MVNIVRRNGGEGREMAAPRARGWDPFRMMRELMHWDPFAELEGLTGGQAGMLSPPVEVRETGDAYVFRVEVPGLSDDDVEISVTGNRLTISGERRETERVEGDRYYAYEFSYGGFSRSFTMPDGTDPDSVRAEMRNGVLTVTVPKRPEVRPKRITIGQQQQQKGQLGAGATSAGGAGTTGAGGTGAAGQSGAAGAGAGTTTGAPSSTTPTAGGTSSPGAGGPGRKP